MKTKPDWWDEVRKNTPIDSRIQPLITELNKVGLKTLYSCQGHNGGIEDAYFTLDIEYIHNIMIDKKTVSIYFRRIP